MKLNLFKKNFIKNKTKQVATVDIAIGVTKNIDYSKNDNEYQLVFNDNTKNEIPCQLISIGSLKNSNLSDTLTIYKNEIPIIKLEFQYTYFSSSKLEAKKFNNFIAVGISGFFYLYDLSTETINLFIDFNGYVGDLFISENHLLISYQSGMYCLYKYGQIKWHNNDIGIDGVLITKVENGKIYGSEQLDPPDGWFDFILDFETGNKINL
jgi:hypothetical protein